MFQSWVWLLSCRLFYFSLHDEYPPFSYTTRSIYIAALPVLINWIEKQCSKSNILAMDHELVFGNSSSTAVYKLPSTIIYLEAVSNLNIRLRQICKTELEPKITVRKIENSMLCYDCKDSRPLCWKLKTLGWWLFLFS